MSYELKLASNVREIKECEYGVAETIQFTKFTSCIGVIAKVKDRSEVIGIHLVLIDPSDNPFSEDDVPTVKNVLKSYGIDKAKTKVIGQIDFWK